MKCSMNIRNLYCHRLAFYQASLEEVTLACQLMPFGAALCFSLHDKARGKDFVKGNLWSLRSAKPDDDALQRIAQCPTPGYRILQLHIEQPQRRESTTRTSRRFSFETLHITQESVKAHDKLCNIIFFSQVLNFTRKQDYLECG